MPESRIGPKVVTYIGWGGRCESVETDLDLGRGSTRGKPRSGLRRAIWDAAYGYVNGFKVTAILYFVLTRSFSRKVAHWAMRREGVEFINGLPQPRRCKDCDGCGGDSPLAAEDRIHLARCLVQSYLAIDPRLAPILAEFEKVLDDH